VPVFIRTIDVTKDGHAVPVVDDLAGTSLTLSADEQGYKQALDESSWELKVRRIDPVGQVRRTDRF
jgi:hypothetical protein